MIQVHVNPAFGWHIAKTYALARERFPETVLGRDHWLFQAYLFHLNPSRHFSPIVLDAYHISQREISAKLKATLITGLGQPVDDHLNSVAEKTGIPRDTVEAFEILFFNVLDRHEDGLYLSNIAYPEGRQVEFDEAYFETASVSDLLLRAAYNYRDIDLVLRLAGMDASSCTKEIISLKAAEAELEVKTLANALVMAKSGLINQPNVGIHSATALLTASRKARKDTVADLPENPELWQKISTQLAAAVKSLPPLTKADHADLRETAVPGRAYYSDERDQIFAFPDELHPVPQESLAHSELYAEAKPATWRNKDNDMPVMITGIMRAPGFPDHYLAESGTGLPASEVFFEN